MGHCLKLVALVDLSVMLIIHLALGDIAGVDTFMTNGTEFGYFIILFGLLIAKASNRLEFIYSITGSTLFIINSLIILIKWFSVSHQRGILETSSSRGLLAILEGILLFANAMCPDNNEVHNVSPEGRAGEAV